MLSLKLSLLLVRLGMAEMRAHLHCRMTKRLATTHRGLVERSQADFKERSLAHLEDEDAMPLATKLSTVSYREVRVRLLLH